MTCVFIARARSGRTQGSLPKSASARQISVWRCVGVMVCSLVWGGCIAGGPAPVCADDPPDDVRQVQVTDAQGQIHRGALSELSPTQVGLGPGDPRRLATRNLIMLKFAGRQMHLAAESPIVVLATGEFLALQTEAISDAALTGQLICDPELPAVSVPLEAIRGVVFDRPANSQSLSRLLELMLVGTESHDTVILRNGDRLEGEFVELQGAELTLKSAAGLAKIRSDGVQALALNPTLSVAEPFRGEGALVTLVDGSRFRARQLRLVGPDQLTCEPQFGGRWSLPLSAVDAIRFLGGAATWLSDLEPARYEFEPFLQLEWPLQRNRSVAGGFLQVRGVEYALGLGVHSRSTVTYALPGKYRRFQATLGIDDITAGKGNAVYEVLVDGKRVFQSPALTGTSPALVIDPIDLTGAKTLSLRVDFGGDADMLDHANWCDAVLVR